MPQKSRAAEWDGLPSAAQMLQCLHEAIPAKASSEDLDIFRSAASEILWRDPVDQNTARTHNAQREDDDIHVHLVRGRPLEGWNVFRSLERRLNCYG